MKSKSTIIMILSAITLIAVLFQSCSTDSDEPLEFNIVSMTVGDHDLNAATAPNSVSVVAKIVITFNSNVNAASATSANISLIQEFDDSEMTINISVSGATITIQPESNLGSGALYRLELKSGIRNADDQPLANTSRTFRTAGTFSPPGMIAHWLLDGDANDAVGSYNASDLIDITYGEARSESSGQVATFNGNTSIIEIPNADGLITSTDFSLSFWVKTNSDGHVNENGDPTGHFVLGIGAFFGIQYEIAGNYTSSKFAIRFETEDGTFVSEDMWFPVEATDRNSGGWQGWDFARSLSEDQMINILKDNWLHVVYTFDGNDRKARLYYNGDLMKSFDFDLWPDEAIQRTVTRMAYGGQEPEVVNDFTFGFLQSRAGTLWDNEPWGGYDFPTSNHFKGQLDDIKIYHQVLSDGEVKLIFLSD
ncbi:MAG: LamG-like jellyroll fold domain-containing protein [Balneolaceae bacterium]